MRINFLLTLFTLILGFQHSAAQADGTAKDFYDVSTIQDIKITFEQDNWSYYLDSLRFNGDGLLLGSAEINGQKLENVGVRYRGTKSFSPGSKRNSLHIKLNYISKDQNIQGYKTIKLSSALRDPSMVREVLSYEIAGSYMPTPKANYARVTINGELYGLFVNVEPIGEEFLTRQFGSSDNAFFKVNQEAGNYTPQGCKSKIYGSLEYDISVSCYLNNFEKLSDNGWDDLIELTKTLANNADRIDNVLNVDRTLWMLAFNNVFVNLSSYTGQNSVNYYLYKDENGQFNPIIWDLNLSFGSYKNTGSGSDLKLKGLQELDPFLNADNPTKPLIVKILANDEYRKLYLSHIRRIMSDYLTKDKLENRVKELQDLIREDFKNDPNNRYSIEEFNSSLTTTIGKRSKIPGIIELMGKRSDYLSTHPALAVFPPEISDVKVMARPQFSSQRVENFRISAKVDKFPKKVKVMYRLGDTQRFKEATMYDDGKNNDGGEDDGVYGVTIVPQNGETKIDYYIYAENATLINYSPSNYMWEQHHSSLEDLNK